MNASCRAVQTPTFTHLLSATKPQETALRFPKQGVRARLFLGIRG